MSAARADPFGRDAGERRNGRGRLRAVDEREPLFRLQFDRVEPHLRQRVGAAQDRSIADTGEPFAHEHEGQVGERREVTAGANRATARDHRMDAAVQQLQEQFQGLAPDAGESLRQHIRAQRHGGTHRPRRQRFSDAGRMTAQQVQLQRGQRLARDGRLRERTEARIDPVDRCVASRLPFHHRARSVDAHDRAAIQSDRHRPIRNVDELFEREGVSVEKKHRTGRILRL